MIEQAVIRTMLADAHAAASTAGDGLPEAKAAIEKAKAGLALVPVKGLPSAIRACNRALKQARACRIRATEKHVYVLHVAKTLASLGGAQA